MKINAGIWGSMALLALGIVSKDAVAADFDLLINRPAESSLFGDSLLIYVTAFSTFELKTVQAQVEDRNVNLVYSSTPEGYRWNGTLSLAGLSRGTKTLVITATDAFNNTGQTSREFKYDAYPTVTVIQGPPDGTCIRSNLEVEISASDDDQPAVLAEALVMWMGDWQVLAQANGHLRTNISLAYFDGRNLTLGLAARDSAGRRKIEARDVTVCSTTNLLEVEKVSDGYIADTTSDRIVFRTSAEPKALKVKVRSSGMETAIYSDPVLQLGPSYLCPEGVLFFVSGTNNFWAWKIWDGQDVKEVETDWYWTSVVQKGDLFAWSSGSRIGIMDVRTGVDTVITNFQNANKVTFDMAENGDIYFAPVHLNVYEVSDQANQGVYRYRAGVVSLLTRDSVNPIDFVKTDGTRVFYIKKGSGLDTLTMYDGVGEIVVDQTSSIGRDYLVNNGWVAYPYNTGNGLAQIWKKGLNGNPTKLTFWGTTSTLLSLAPNGEVALSNGNRLYISKGSWPAFEVGPLLNGLRPFHQNGRWYASLGRSLFQIYTGSAEMVSPTRTGQQIAFDLVGAVGQRVVVQSSTNLVDWQNHCTNNLQDGCALQVMDPVNPGLNLKFYRLATP